MDASATVPRLDDPAWSELARATDEAWADGAGIVNAGHGRLVDLAVVAMAEGHHVGPGLHTIGQFLCWKTGISSHTASSIVRIARRADDLPCLVGALRAGEISLDQAEVVARHIPAELDRAATRFAQRASVAQLRKVLPHHRDPDLPTPPPKRSGASISRTGDGDQGILSARLDPADADVVEQALAAAREQLLDQRRADARAAGNDPATVELPTWDEALVAVAESALAHGQAAHPGSERYLVTYHLTQTATGIVALTDHRGRTLPDADRRRLLCDHRFQALRHAPDGTPLSVGRTTHDISRKLRRAILFRHGHTCAVPGCDTTLGPQIHHIWHWEDGGPTDTSNLTSNKPAALLSGSGGLARSVSLSCRPAARRAGTCPCGLAPRRRSRIRLLRIWRKGASQCRLCSSRFHLGRSLVGRIVAATAQRHLVHIHRLMPHPLLARCGWPRLLCSTIHQPRWSPVRRASSSWRCEVAWFTTCRSLQKMGIGSRGVPR